MKTALCGTTQPALSGYRQHSPGTYTWQEAQDYIDELNNNNTLGHGDWRLPTIEELSTLVDAGRSAPAIDPLFSDTVEAYYWSSTPYAADPIFAWTVRFNDGAIYRRDKTFLYYVRAVRGLQYGPFGNFISNNDGTITDTTTELMWQQCGYGQTWDVNTNSCTGSAELQLWEDAQGYVQALNDTSALGYDDWRLPTRNELQSLIDYSLSGPATQFPLPSVQHPITGRLLRTKSMRPTRGPCSSPAAS